MKEKITKILEEHGDALIMAGIFSVGALTIYAVGYSKGASDVVKEIMKIGSGLEKVT